MFIRYISEKRNMSYHFCLAIDPVDQVSVSLQVGYGEVQKKIHSVATYIHTYST
jgi:hypothetical protein